MKALDKIDRNILRTLQTQGRISNVALSEAVHLSPTPCLDRVRRLERDGYIQGYEARLSASHLGSAFVTFMSVSLHLTNEDSFSAFAKAITGFPEVAECHMVGGGFDYLLKIRTADMPEFRRFMAEKISVLPQVAQTHSYFVMEEIKKDPHITVPEA